jgi:ribosomal protein S18 acetylase RimI-like enzyme
VLPERQREGHAFRAFLDLEAEVQRLGLSGIALHVFGHNTGAQALYAKLGFQPTNISLFKPVDPAGA